MYQWLSYMRGYTSRKVGKGEDSIGGEVASRALSLQSENPWSRYLINAPQDCCFRYDWTLTDLLSSVYSFLRSWTIPPFLLCSKFPMHSLLRAYVHTTVYSVQCVRVRQYATRARFLIVWHLSWTASCEEKPQAETTSWIRQHVCTCSRVRQCWNVYIWSA